MTTLTDTIKERPILFSAPMVRAILDGRKTQTRRVIKPQPVSVTGNGKRIYRDEDYKKSWNKHGNGYEECPFGQIGDRLWVRETLKLKSVIDTNTCELGVAAQYAAGGDHQAFMWNGRKDVESIPSIHMPRWASRITIEITDVRVERLQDISEDDALAEGITESQIDRVLDSAERMDQVEPNPARFYFQYLWEDINGPTSWAANPWVWVIGFKQVKGGM